ncbi:hypothetical protein OSTOST_24647, partial [Ostertagia ostertagi]
MEHRKRQFSLKFYYEQFLRVTNAQEAVGNLFNPFILFSLAWSMLVLCLTIYFITQPHSSLVEPISPEQITVPEIRRRLTRSVHFTICWAGGMDCRYCGRRCTYQALWTAHTADLS